MFKAIMVFTLCLMAIALAKSTDSPETAGNIINLENGELCVISSQCKSSCCRQQSAISLSRCDRRAAEGETCSKKNMNETYFFCPCEDGLSCEVDWSIRGSIVNTNVGTCVDRNAPN
ncbi:hypothetical protein MHYP_G00323690 [Metynnis hypsauchen]